MSKYPFAHGQNPMSIDIGFDRHRILPMGKRVLIPHGSVDKYSGKIDRHRILPMGKRVLIPHGSVDKYSGSSSSSSSSSHSSYGNSSSSSSNCSVKFVAPAGTLNPKLYCASDQSRPCRTIHDKTTRQSRMPRFDETR